MNEFHFLRAEWLFALIPWCILIYFIYRQVKESSNWSRICDAALLTHLMTKTDKKSSFPLTLWLLCIGLLGFVALSGPTWEKVEQPVYKQQSSLIIVLDLSESMKATDLTPNRLQRAKMKLIDLLTLRNEGQTGLVVFAGTAYTVVPLTDDSATIIAQIDYLKPSLMPSQGSRADLAITKAAELFKQASVHKGHILFITDGMPTVSPSSLRKLLPSGFQLHIIGLGSKAGSPIPNGQQGFFLEHNGQIVISTLDKSHLRKLALSGNGLYQDIQLTDQDLDKIMPIINSRYTNDSKQTEKITSDQWREMGPWFVLALLPLAMFMFRRGLFLLLVCLIPLTPKPVYALDMDYLWQSADQQAQALMQQGDPKAASALFENPEWKASAAYRSKDYQNTLDTLEEINTPDSHYNRGNAYAKQQNYSAAIDAYSKAIALNPEHKDARYNSDLIKKHLEEQKQKDEKSKDKQGKEGQKDKDQENQNSDPTEQQNPSDNKDANQSPDEESKQPQKGDQQEDTKPDQQNESSSVDEKKRADQAQKELEKDAAKKQKAAQKEAKQINEEKKEDSDQDTKTQQLDQDEKSLQQNNNLSDEKIEQLQVKQQLLNKIPDNPGELWRRKFEYQYKRSQIRSTESQPW